MEQVREIKITISITTNKGTSSDTFDNMRDATAFYKSIMKDME